MKNLFPGKEKKLRIGVFTRDPEKLDNWENRIIKTVLEHPNLELCLFVRNSGKSAYNSSLNAVLSIQMKIESLVFKKPQTVDPAEITEQTKDIETICMNPVREGSFDVFSEEDTAKVKEYNLDIILQLEFSALSGSILQAARYGIWSFYHSGVADNRVRLAGFSETVKNEPFHTVMLHDGKNIIDRACLNLYWSFFRANNDLLENSVALLLKNINRLLRQGAVETGEPISQYLFSGKNPGLNHTFIYLFKFYSSVFQRILCKFFPVKRLNCWALFLGRGNFLEKDLSALNPAAMPKDVFWADPFLYRHENQLYVFFEAYPYKTGKGKLSAGRVVEEGNERYKVTDVVDILDLKYHLSYPQIFEEDGQVFLMPETYQNKRLEVYRCTHFPEKWELYSTAFTGEEMVDTTYFRDDNGERWLFLNKGWTFDSELHIYKIDSLKMENITAHASNPVILDCRLARSGGVIFRLGNEVYRPSQINTHGIYGKGLQISRIKKLTLDEFEYEPAAEIYPVFRKGLTGMHHLHQYENNFVFDGCFKKL